MQISDIAAETRSLCDADSTSYPNADILRRFNISYETVVGKIIRNDGTWQFDDDNFTSSPRGVVNLTSGQHMYTFSDKFLQIEEVDILDTSSYFRRIKPWDPSEHDVSFEEFFGISFDGTNYTAPSGFPSYYDKQGNVIRFDTAPTASDTTLTKGLRVVFKRTASIISLSDLTTGTFIPGFDSQFHILLCYLMALPYCESYKKDRVPIYEKKIMDLEKDLLKHYSQRQKDVRHIMTMKKILYI